MEFELSFKQFILKNLTTKQIHIDKLMKSVKRVEQRAEREITNHSWVCAEEKK